MSKSVFSRLEIEIRKPLLRFDLSCVFLRRRIAESAVWPLFVVIPPPGLNLVPGIIQADEPVLIRAFLPEPAVEGLDISVVGRLPRTGKVQSDVIPIGPEIGVPRNELRAIINPNRSGSPTMLHVPLQDLDHLAAAYPLAHMDRRAFTGMIVDYR